MKKSHESRKSSVKDWIIQNFDLSAEGLNVCDIFRSRIRLQYHHEYQRIITLIYFRNIGRGGVSEEFNLHDHLLDCADYCTL